MASINQMNTGTVSKAALGKRLRYGWSAYGPFLHCRPTYIVIKTSPQGNSVDWNTIYVGLQCSLEHLFYVGLQCSLEHYYFMSAYSAVWNTILLCRLTVQSGTLLFYVGLQCSLEHYLSRLTMQSGTLFMSAYSAVWNTIYAGLQCSLEHHLQCGLEDYLSLLTLAIQSRTPFKSAYNAVWTLFKSAWSAVLIIVFVEHCAVWDTI